MYTDFNDNRASAIFFDCPACRVLTLAFNGLTPSFERTSYRNSVQLRKVIHR